MKFDWKLSLSYWRTALYGSRVGIYRAKFDFIRCTRWFESNTAAHRCRNVYYLLQYQSPSTHNIGRGRQGRQGGTKCTTQNDFHFHMMHASQFHSNVYARCWQNTLTPARRHLRTWETGARGPGDKIVIDKNAFGWKAHAIQMHAWLNLPTGGKSNQNLRLFCVRWIEIGACYVCGPYVSAACELPLIPIFDEKCVCFNLCQLFCTATHSHACERVQFHFTHIMQLRSFIP